ncbi:transglutaminase domain-containing protein [Candidatus Saccharibacteria bacterium]|jgi:hypothetical protein|nr:transglutaminase domain-containing protein [Candidatus Saccharibacteria bacterium]
MKRLSLSLLTVFALLLFPIAVSAEGVRYELASTYKSTNKTVKVSHKINISSKEQLGEQTLKLPGTAEDLSVKDGGESLDFTDNKVKASARSIQYTATEIKLNLGQTMSTELDIEYQAKDLLADLKQSQNVLVPPFELGGEVTKQTIEISAPLDGLGGTLVGIKPESTSTTGDVQTYKFKRNALIDTPIVLQNGASASAKLELEADLENTGFWWTTKTVVLPLDTNQQQSYIESIRPRPTKVRVDKDGNISASFRLRPFKKIKIKATADVVMEQKSYDLENEAGFQQIPVDIAADYTGNTDIWPDKWLQNLGLNKQELRKKTVLQATEEVYKAVADKSGNFNQKFSHRDRIGNSNQQISTSLDNADVLTSALRSVGIPARVVGGVITNNQLSVLDKAVNHVWVEAYVPEIGWMTIDPVQGKFGKEFFGQSGAERTGLSIWGVNDKLPDFEPSEVKIEYNNENLPKEKFTNDAVGGQNFVLLPGISLQRAVASMPAGVIHDEVAIRSGGKEQQLGSLAPLQKMSVFQIKIGSDSWKTSKLDLVVGGEKVSSGNTKVNYLFVVIEALLLIMFGWFMIQWRKKSNAPFVIAEDSSDEHEIEGQNLLPPKVPQSRDENTHNQM